MSAEKTLAIVLRVVEFSESSYIATLYTQDFGKLTGLAKGARRAKSAFENALDVLAVSRVVFLRKSTDGMDLLTEAKLERRFHASTRDLRRLYSAYYVVELLSALTDEHDPQPELFRMALRTLVELDEDGDVRACVLRFELAVLASLGQVPMLEQCVECGVPLPADTRVAFGHLVGGVLCARCKVGQRHVVSLSANGANLLRQLLREVKEIENGTDGDLTPLISSSLTTASRLQPDDAFEPQENQEDETQRDPTVEGKSGKLTMRSVTPAWGELRGLMDNRMSHALGRRPRMFPYLKAIK